MLRSSVSLPLRLLRETAPVPRTLLASTLSAHQPTIPSPPSHSQPFSTTSVQYRGPPPKKQQWQKKKKRYPTPEAKRVAEMRLRKNVARQATLSAERTAAFGDAVWGNRDSPTEFVQSLDAAQDADIEAVDSGADPSVSSNKPTPATTKQPLLNSFLRTDEVRENLDVSRQLTAPVEERGARASASRDPVAEERRRERHVTDHGVAAEAIERIVAVGMANGKQRKHINIQRCIERFGRHETDLVFGGVKASGEVEELKMRVGPDTGSSEVQIALLTMKIRKLAQEREGPLRGDKINKRNLRVLLHKRQKMLKYLYRQDRGGPRWKNVCQTLGITDAMWKGEIVLL